MQCLHLSNYLGCLSKVQNIFAAIYKRIIYSFRNKRLTARAGNVARFPADVVEPPPVSGNAKDEVIYSGHFTVNIATMRIFNISNMIYGL